MEHSYPYSEHTESQLLEFLEDEVLKFAEITTHEFLSLGCAGTFRWLGYYKKHSYSVFSGRENTDYYVRQALKLYDFAYFKKLHGYTRKPKLGCALSRFLHFARPVHTKKQGFIDDFSPEESEWLNICYENAQVACGQYLFGNKINDGFKPLSSFHEAVDSLPTNTSAGFSYPGKKKGEVKNLARRKATLMHDLITHGHKVTKVPSTIALRGHLSPVDQLKSRTIILYPYEVQILEAKLYKPLYTQMKKVSPIISGDSSLQRLHSYLHLNPNYTFINTDISGWDRMRSIFLIRDAFKVLNSYMDFSSQDKLVSKWLADYLINTPIMLPDGNLFRKKGGIPSGTFLTLLINSACNYIAQHTLLNYLNIRYYDLSVLGDDCAFFMSEGETWNNLFSEFCRLNMKVFCLRMNEEKSVATDNLTDRKFIGYQFKGLELYRETDEFFKAALYPESDVKNVAISFSRLFSYLCIGGINDSKFFSFFEFFCTSYQDSLRLFKRELFKEKVFRFGSLRVFKDMLNFRIEDVINLDFDSFLNLDWYAVRWMFSLNVSIQKKDVNYFVDDN